MATAANNMAGTPTILPLFFIKITISNNNKQCCGTGTGIVGTVTF
jgi:hypothetical protein